VIIRILALLILGVVTTVGVAWGLAAGFVPLWLTVDRDIDGIPDGISCGNNRWGRSATLTDSEISEVTVRVGAPALSLSAKEWCGWPHSEEFIVRRDSFRTPFERESMLGPVPMCLPLRPIFPGFLVNTLFYAAIWFGIFFGVATLRRFVRKKRGRCVKCSYDLRGEFEIGCPECGWNRDA